MLLLLLPECDWEFQNNSLRETLKLHYISNILIYFFYFGITSDKVTEEM